MLETLREYALEQLESQGEAADLGAEHATYFLALAEHAASQLDGEQGAAWLERLECEHDNLRDEHHQAFTFGNARHGASEEARQEL